MADPEAFDHPVHFTDLDGLRGVLALSVVLLHYGINSAVQRLSHGRLAGFTFQLSVDFFFVLSGFVLAYSMRDGRPSVAAFAVKRWFRLVPVHYACLAVMLALAVAAPGPIPYLPQKIPAATILGDVAMATPIIWPGRDAINVPSWSVGWELYLPIVAVALSRFIGPVARRWGVALVLLGCCAMSVTAVGVATGGHFYGIRAALGLATGGVLFGVWQDRCAHWRPSPVLLHSLIAGMGAVMLASASFPPVAVLFPWLAASTVIAGTRTRSVLSSRPVAWLGRISYTLYMVHVPVLVAAIYVAGPRVTGSVPLKGMVLLLALAAAAALTRWIERPAMDLGRRARGLLRQSDASAPRG